MALTKQYKVVLVDTSSDQQLANFLQENGYEVITVQTGQEVLQIVKKELPNVIIIDLVMPELDGIETCIDLREEPLLKKSFIVFYTDRSEEYSQIAAFKAGADDFIVRPVANKVFLTRLNALFRRLENPSKDTSKSPEYFLPFNLSIDRERYMVRQDGKEIQLPRKEFELLALLCSSPRKVFSRQEISSNIWGFEMEAKNRTIDVHIRKLREKIGMELIKTVKGIGYKIEI